MSAEPDRMIEIARQFSDYLRGQTGIDLTFPATDDTASLRESLELLDLALAQVADLASVYGADPRGDIEPLAVPTAVITGEFIRIASGGRWMEPAFEGDLNLLLVSSKSVVFDLEGLARTALMSRQPAIAPLVMKLLTDS